MKKIVSFLAVGHSPREDIVDELAEHIDSGIEIRQRGALDHLSVEEVREKLIPVPGEPVLTSRLSDGKMMDFSREKVMPLLQSAIDSACEEGASIVVILCTNEFDGLHCRVPLITPFYLLHSVASSVRAGCRAGALFPFKEFAEAMEKSWKRFDVSVDYECASPKENDWGRYVEFFREKKTQLLILDCIGYTYECRDYFSRALGIPVIHPRSMIVSTIHDMLASGPY